MQKNKFNQSIEDINDFFSLLEYIDSIEAYKGTKLIDSTIHSSLLVTSNQQKCMRSHAVLMLYNIVESTVEECILAIFDAIQDEHLKYHELEDSLRDQWLRTKIKDGDSIKTRIALTKEIIVNINSNILYENATGLFNGNVDLRKILDVFKGFKLELGSIPNKDKVAVTLKAVKDARNHLAHGDITYSNFGSSILLSDIIRYKEETLNFLFFFMNKVECYILSKKYKK
jgi:hypothetical protein